MPLMVTIITEDDLLDFVNDNADAATRSSIEAAALTDDRVWRQLQSIRRANRVLSEMNPPSKRI